jgi:glutathione synthase
VAHRYLFVMDPLATMLVDKDTTFAFMLEAIARGHEIYFAALHDLFARGHQPYAFARRCEVMRAVPHHQFLDEGTDYQLEHFHTIFMRKDPPVDTAYAYAAMLLALADTRRTFVINRPEALLTANEKLYQLNFPEVIPPTLVTYEVIRLKKFMAEQGGQMIVKPLGGHGGEGVFLVSVGDRNLGAILETVTRFETQPIMAQRYIPEVRNGDKRLIVLNGEPIGGTLRVPRDDGDAARSRNLPGPASAPRARWALFCGPRYHRRVRDRGECDESNRGARNRSARRSKPGGQGDRFRGVAGCDA